MVPPKVSVLMCVYNGAKFVERAVRSILSQTCTDFEFVIVDNKSTDDTFEILRRWEQADSRIRLYQNERNLGLVASLNRGLHVARGEYIARMDADDFSRPDRLALQLAFMERHTEVGVCGGQILVHRGAHTYLRRYALTPEECDATLLFQSCVAHPSVMFRRRLTSEDGFFYDEEFQCAEDSELWRRMAPTVRFANLPETLLDYYSHDDQESAKYSIASPNVNRSRARVVRVLLPNATDDELEFHHLVSNPQELINTEQLARAEQWLLHLVEANREVRRYDALALRRVLGRQWLLVCGHATRMGMATLLQFTISPLRTTRITAPETAKLFVKCLLKKDPLT